MTIVIKKDGDGYLASVRGQAHLFAWAETKKAAETELAAVAEMMMDYHLEQIEIERKVKATLTPSKKPHAVHVSRDRAQAA